MKNIWKANSLAIKGNKISMRHHVNQNSQFLNKYANFGKDIDKIEISYIHDPGYIN